MTSMIAEVPVVMGEGGDEDEVSRPKKGDKLREEIPQRSFPVLKVQARLTRNFFIPFTLRHSYRYVCTIV